MVESLVLYAGRARAAWFSVGCGMLAMKVLRKNLGEHKFT